MLFGQHRACCRATGWIPDQRRVVPDDDRDAVSEVLELADFAQDDGKAEVDVGGCRVKPEFYDKWLAGFCRLFELGTKAIFGNDEGCSALKELYLLIQIHAGIVSLTARGLLAPSTCDWFAFRRRTGWSALFTCSIRIVARA